VGDCIALHWFRYAMGRIENQTDSCSIEQVQTALDESGGNLKEMLVAMTLSDAFSYRPPLEEEK
jgi:hypothetical protein